MTKLVANWTTQTLVALRDKPSRFGYVVLALLFTVILFTLADFLPAPYDFSH